MDLDLATRKFYDYSLFMRGYSAATISRYDRVIKVYKKYANLIQVQDINETNLKGLFIHGRTNLSWKAGTFITYHRSLSVFVAWCVKNGYLPSNPVKDIELPKLEKRLPTKLTKQDAFKLLEVVYNFPYDYQFLRHRNLAIFSMLLFVGLRRSELIKLKYTDVDTDNHTIFIRQGKGNKDRIIPMSFTLAQNLRGYIVERKRLNKTCPEFFTSLNRNMGFTWSGLKRLVEKISKASGVKFTLHTLRHSFATLMLEGGCDIYSLSKMMGHSNITTTTIYLSASVEHLRGQITKHPLNEPLL
jgi:site-specific recombinase XerD